MKTFLTLAFLVIAPLFLNAQTYKGEICVNKMVEIINSFQGHPGLMTKDSDNSSPSDKCGVTAFRHKVLTADRNFHHSLVGKTVTVFKLAYIGEDRPSQVLTHIADENLSRVTCKQTGTSLEITIFRGDEDKVIFSQYLPKSSEKIQKIFSFQGIINGIGYDTSYRYRCRML